MEPKMFNLMPPNDETFLIRPMTKSDNEAVARFFLDVYNPVYWFWAQLWHGVVFARDGVPWVIMGVLGVLYVLTEQLLLAVGAVAGVILVLSFTLTVQFWLYVRDSSDLATATSYERYCLPKGGGFWVAMSCDHDGREGQLLGTAALVRNSAKEAEIFRMAVARNAGRRGVATKLLHVVEDFARKEKYERLVLWTSNAQAKGLRFYQKHGFCVVRRCWHENRPMPISVNVMAKSFSPFDE